MLERTLLLILSFAAVACGDTVLPEPSSSFPGGSGGAGGITTGEGSLGGASPSQCSWTKGGSGDGCGVTFTCPDGEFIFFCLINPMPHCICNPGGERDYATYASIDYCTDQKTSAAVLNPVCGWNVD